MKFNTVIFSRLQTQRLILAAGLIALTAPMAAVAQNPFLGEIRWVGFNFTPRGYAPCDGQLMQIAGNTALFALYGTFYGGDGRTTFALPDMRGRSPLHTGTGPGLAPVSEGDQRGQEAVVLTASQLPAHSHSLNVSSADGDTVLPSATTLQAVQRLPLQNDAGSAAFDDQPAAASVVAVAPNAIGITGSSASVSVRDPALTIRCIVATEGIFPSRN